MVSDTSHKKTKDREIQTDSSHPPIMNFSCRRRLPTYYPSVRSHSPPAPECFNRSVETRERYNVKCASWIKVEVIQCPPTHCHPDVRKVPWLLIISSSALRALQCTIMFHSCITSQPSPPLSAVTHTIFALADRECTGIAEIRFVSTAGLPYHGRKSI